MDSLPEVILLHFEQPRVYTQYTRDQRAGGIIN